MRQDLATILLIVLLVVVVIALLLRRRDRPRRNSDATPTVIDLDQGDFPTPSIPTSRTCPSGFELMYEQIANLSDQIYNQYQLLDEPLIPYTSRRVLRHTQEHVIDIFAPYPGTEIDPSQPIYGYNDDQTIDPTGGPLKSFNPEFKYFHLNVHSTDDLVDITQDDVMKAYDRIIAYYAQRGFQLAKSDEYDGYREMFGAVASSPAGAGTPLGFPSVFLKFIFAQGANAFIATPEFVDVVVHGIPITFTPGLYEPDQSLWQSYVIYPLRVPVTTDFCGTFQAQQGIAPIAYYDAQARKIAIHIPPIDDRYVGFDSVQTGNPNLDYEAEFYFTAFDGTFSLLRRNSQNELVLTTPGRAQYLAQVSQTLYSKSSYWTDYGGLEEYELETGLYFGDAYIGLVLAHLGSGTGSMDVYLTHAPDGSTTYVQTIDPTTDHVGRFGYAPGDNPATKLIEALGGSSSVTLRDSIYETDKNAFLQLPRSILEGNTYPEQNGDQTIVPLSPSITSVIDALFAILGHESTHLWHSVSLPSAALVPTEAVAMMQSHDPALSNNTMIYESITKFVSSVFRAEHSVLVSEDYYKNFLNSAGTYSMVFFFDWFRTQHDRNNQIIRRLVDILASETVGPIMRAQSLAFLDIYILNSTANWMAFRQALQENGLDVRDIMTNFAIASTMFRNNTAIPSKYRYLYPYWLMSASYPSTAAMFTRYDWDEIQENALQYDYSSGGKIKLFAPLPAAFDAEVTGMTTLIREVPADATSVVVTADSGNWRVAMVQFTSDGTPLGTFKQDPSVGNTVNMAPGNVWAFGPQFMNYTPGIPIYLVLVNVDIFDYAADSGNPTGNFTDEEYPIARILVTHDGTEEPQSLPGPTVTVGSNTYKVAYTTRGSRDLGTTSAQNQVVSESNACAGPQSGVTGRFAVVESSAACNSRVFVANILAGNPTAILIIDRQGNPTNYGGVVSSVPQVVVSSSDGDAILAYLALNPTATITLNNP